MKFRNLEIGNKILRNNICREVDGQTLYDLFYGFHVEEYELLPLSDGVVKMFNFETAFENENVIRYTYKGILKQQHIKKGEINILYKKHNRFPEYRFIFNGEPIPISFANELQNLFELITKEPLTPKF